METTLDKFLGGHLLVRQPKSGYRAGIDPVMLAASIPAKQGQMVLELGCGVGVASLCLAKRVAGLTVHGVELQEAYADLAIKNAEENNVPLSVQCADLSYLPDELKSQTFDHVIMNPPYFDRDATVAASDEGRETAMGEATALKDWVTVASKRVRTKGTVSFIFRTERFPDLLNAMPSTLGSLQMFPIQPRVGRASELFILRARKLGRAAFRLEAPIVMHEGAQHSVDGESYREDIQRVLRHGAALPIPMS